MLHGISALTHVSHLSLNECFMRSSFELTGLPRAIALIGSQLIELDIVGMMEIGSTVALANTAIPTLTSLRRLSIRITVASKLRSTIVLGMAARGLPVLRRLALSVQRCWPHSDQSLGVLDNWDFSDSEEQLWGRDVAEAVLSGSTSLEQLSLIGVVLRDYESGNAAVAYAAALPRLRTLCMCIPAGCRSELRTQRPDIRTGCWMEEPCACENH
jgi:hypothetical protein